MKLGKIDFCKIQKMTAIEVFVLVIVFFAIGIYYSPNFMHKKDVMMAAKIKADNAIFTAKALEEFAQDKNAKASVIAKKVADELNVTTKNPYDKKQDAYSFDNECKSCNNVSYDDNNEMIILTTFNKKGELIARTVIKPPSFVVYSIEDDKKPKK